MALLERLRDVGPKRGGGDGGPGPGRGFRERLRTIPRTRLAALAVLFLVLAGGAALVLRGDDDGSTRVPEAGAQRTAERRTSFLARLIPPAPEATRPRGPRVPRSVTDLVKRLPIERKAAQLFVLGFQGTDLNAAIFYQFRRLDLGGLVIDSSNYTDPQQLSSLAGEAVLISQQRKHVPPWVLAAQEGGDFNVFSDLPPATAAADLRSVEQAAAEAREAGATLKPLGISGVLAPVVDVGDRKSVV